jgi:hypothetical protein
MAQTQQAAYRAFTVVKREGQDDFWLPIGAAFAHEKGDGFNVILQALTDLRRRWHLQNRSPSSQRRGRRRADQASSAPSERQPPWSRSLMIIKKPAHDADSRPHREGKLRAIGISDGSFIMPLSPDIRTIAKGPRS